MARRLDMRKIFSEDVEDVEGSNEAAAMDWRCIVFLNSETGTRYPLMIGMGYGEN